LKGGFSNLYRGEYATALATSELAFVVLPAVARPTFAMA